MHSFKPFIILLFISFCSYAQTEIKGLVKDSTDIIAFANVYLTDQNNKIVTGTTSDESGAFSLSVKEGNYKLTISFIGYLDWTKDIDLTANQNLGVIVLSQDSSQLDEVVVTAKKPLIERKVDRLVFNVENSIASQGMSGLDALRNTPLVRVQNDNVSIVGKGKITVMVNDKILHLSGNELTNYLQSLQSDNIEKIEVITTPPSKYDAEGNSGIINIKLKRNLNLGWSGTVSASYQRNSYNGIRTGATINYQSNTISSSLKLRQYDISYKVQGRRNLIGPENSVLTSELRKDRAKSIGLNYSLDFKLNNKQNIGFIYDFNSQNYNIDADGKSIYKTRSTIDSTLTTSQIQKWETPTHTLNIYYDIALDTLGKKLNFTGNFLSNLPNKVNDFATDNNETSQKTTIRNNSDMDYGIYSGQADLMLPYKWSNIELGAKYTLFKNKSNLGYFNLVGGNYIIFPTNSNIFNYNEHNYATYISFQKDFDKKWSTKVGLRYEYTALSGKTPGNESSNVKNDYGKLFPTAYLSYKPDEKNTFSINYSKRINRPSFQSLNPFRWYTNPYIYFTGTPTLQPSFNDNIELSYSRGGKFSLSLYNQYSKNNSSNIARLENGIYSNKVENSYNQNIVGLSLDYYDTLFKIWEMSFSSNGTYTVTTPTIPDVERLRIYSLYYSINNTFTLNNNKTWFLLLNFWHNLPFTYANIKLKDQLNFSTGIRTSFLDKKLKVSVVASDVFRTLKNQGFSYNNGYRSEFYNYNDHRIITLSVSYSFGSNKVKGTNKNIKFEEKHRAN